MQFHLDGFRPGDPDLAPADPRHEAARAAEAMPSEVDVLIVGCGPAGLTLAAQLARFPEIITRIIDLKPGPLEVGQADGVACRSMEMFNAFGFAERVMREAYWVSETSFWTPDPARPEDIARSGRIQDVEDGLSEFPHVILNQARVHAFYLDVMRRAPTRLAPDYARRLRGLEIETEGDPSHPVTVTLERLDAGGEGRAETLRARHVVGCDGARSAVRGCIGQALKGDSANQAWGVMDVLAVTDFPDIRLKCVIQTAGAGTAVIIPREGGHLVRLYIEMDDLEEGERAADRAITVDALIEAARRILRPHSLEVKEVAWWSVYEIGQRLCDRFDDVPEAEIETRLPRVFIAGDACHTHSPKAGQGMNVSMRDGFNLGWKLAAVLRGEAAPELLRTYSAERRAVARELIDFDREFARMIGARAGAPAGEEGAAPAAFQAHFEKQGRFTAGTETCYAPSIICGGTDHQRLAEGFPVGRRFHSAPVIRLADARPMHLGHVVKADGRWRLIAFSDADGLADPQGRLRRMCGFVADHPFSPAQLFGRTGADPDAWLDLRAVLQQGHREVEPGDLPPALLPRKGRLGLIDYEKAFCPDLSGGRDVFDLRGINREDGCLVVVRPDQHVAHVLPLDAYEDLTAFFKGFMLRRA